MKLYFAENFLNAFAELPKGIQKKVYDFIIKFRCNSLSHSLHLEPISTFKDRHLRTARVDLKYRAIIYANDSGEEYYLLWVDNHDEAMQWASNKIFNWIQNPYFQITNLRINDMFIITVFLLYAVN
jgi:hypothetical protein